MNWEARHKHSRKLTALDAVVGLKLPEKCSHTQCAL